MTSEILSARAAKTTGTAKTIGATKTTSVPPWRKVFDANDWNAVTTLPHEALLAWLNQRSQAQGLKTGFGRPLCFVPASALPTDHAYESWIADTGCVPTRDNLHDRYNALMWICCPLTKARLNAVQAQALHGQKPGGARGAVRDAATLWDENLAVIVAHADPTVLQERLALQDWNFLFLAQRSQWRDRWMVVPFGHALLDKLAAPYKGITAHTLIAPMPSWSWNRLDLLLAARVRDDMTPAMFRPLPVMGIPTWNAENEAPSFYRDTAVFRPLRST